jgi:class 3 adenylate cyclase
VIICPACGQENPEGFRFCGACAAPLQPAPAAREERKVITALFCDLVGSTAQGERLDPEDLQALLARYHGRVRTELERFGGTVEKFIGDAVVALFGAPVAHEDDPERAVRAALAVREWVDEQPDLHVRMAINTGEALVILSANPAQGEHLASGDVLNTAARLQGAAPVDGILVGEQTFRATERVIEYRERGPVEAKGKATPVKVWEVVQARSRFGVDVEHAPKTALIGRARELRLLTEAFERAREEREPQLVTLVGVPGIGKSRVVYELSRIADADPGLVTWRQGRCLPYGDGVSFWALAEMVKAQAGILESDSPDKVDTKLRAMVAGLVAESDADWVLGWLKPLVGRGAEERSRATRDESFAAWRRLLEGIAERGTTVLVFEDLHWADEGLLDFLDELAEWASGVPLLILCTARPELLAKRPGWGGGRTNALTLSLPPLSSDETARLVHGLLHRAVLPVELQQAVLERADGNPLYAEEFARMVTERGMAEVAVPESVQGIIASRLDALSPAHKRLLQDGSVVGKVFWVGAVAALSDAAAGQIEQELRELQRRELIRRERRSSVEGELEYAFRHVLTRDIAYAQIPRAERSDRHRRAAEWISTLGRPEDHAELLAQHYLEALEYARAAGADVTAFTAPALAAVREAGERALTLGAYHQATRYFKAALELVGDADPLRGELLYRYGNALYWETNRRGKEELEQAVALLRSTAPEQAARAALLLVNLEWVRGDRERVLRRHAEVDELLTELPHSLVRAEALLARAATEMFAANYDSAIELAREALGRIEGDKHPDLRARAFDVIGTCRVALGDAEGTEDQRRAVQIAREGRAAWQLATAQNNLGVSLVELGLLDELDQNLEERRRALEQLGGTAGTKAWFFAAEANANYLAGRWDAALASIERVLGDLREGESHYLEPDVRPVRAWIEFARDQPKEALADAERGVEIGVRSRDPQALAGSLCVQAFLLLADGRIEWAATAFEQLINLGHGAAPGLNVSANLSDFAWVAVGLDRRAEAERVVRRSEAPRWQAAAEAVLGGDARRAADLLDEIGHRPAAAYARLRAGGDHVNAALDFYRSVGATRYIREAESHHAASA